jgi:hypothetical protein
VEHRFSGAFAALKNNPALAAEVKSPRVAKTQRYLVRLKAYSTILMALFKPRRSGA